MALAGIFPITPTPFDEQGRIDVESIQTMTAFMLRCGVDGLAVLGVMGEVDRLTDAERDQVVEAFRRALPAGKALVVGAGANGTDAAIQACRRAEGLGADALLVTPPRIQNEGVLFGYYERVAKAAVVPLIIQDYPPATDVLMTPALLARLYKELERVEYVKLEDAPTGPKMERIRALAGETFGIFGALGGLYAFEELERGAVGIMSGLAYPELLVRLYRLHRAGDAAGAAALFYDFVNLARFEFQPGIGVSLRKEILVRRGAIRTATVRHPGAVADAMTLRQLDRIVGHLVARGHLEPASSPAAAR
ncbi:MAG TPA: dihydrodipicolinate synthase family protein [bacterium]|nr:dihydrodipicolinate synthase family protein [bacterium]